MHARSLLSVLCVCMLWLAAADASLKVTKFTGAATPAAGDSTDNSAASTSATAASATTTGEDVPHQTVPECPAQPRVFSSMFPNPKPVDLVLVNRAGVSIEVRWVNWEGKEQGMGTVPKDVKHVQSSYAGHGWRIYARPLATSTSATQPATPILIHEIAIAQDATSPLRITVLPCAGLHVPQAAQDVVPEDWRVPVAQEAVPASELVACAPETWLSEVESEGFHIICVLPLPEGVMATSARARLVVFKDGQVTDKPLSFLVPFSVGSLDQLVRFVKAVMGIYIAPGRQSPALFTPKGNRLGMHAPITIDDALVHPALFYFEGGQWIWPGVRIGHTVAVGNLLYPNQTTYITTMSLKPKVFQVQNFLATDECEDIIQRASPHMTKSTVATKDSDIGRKTEEWRVSNFHFISSVGYDHLQNIERRVQELIHIPNTHSEDTQVLRYDQNGFYSAHHDYFNPSEYAGNPDMMRRIDNGNRNRMVTVFFYLNDVPSGGETGFPRAGGLPQPTNYKDCTKGIAVKPEKGKVIVFYSMLPNGELDELSLHGGCGVKEGVKWSANFWVWNDRNYDRLRSRHDGYPEHLASIMGQPIFPQSATTTHDEL